MRRRVVITGGAGFIGSHAVRRFRSQDDEVIVFDNLSSGRRENLPSDGDVRLVEGTILDTDVLSSACEGAEVIVHLAAEPSVQKSVDHPLETHQTNYVGTLSVAEAARRTGVSRIVYASSAAVYANEGPGAVEETSKVAPSSPYGVDKLSGEYLLGSWAHLHGIPSVSLRLFNVYGERQQANSPYSGVISIFANCVMERKAIRVFGDGLQSRDFVYVGDVAEAIYLAASTELPGARVMNVGTGISTTLLELIETLGEVEGAIPEIVREKPRPGDIRHSLASVATIRDSLGFRSETALREGLSALLSWAKSHAIA